ncbi:ankyrin repeat-containing domain protein [Lophiotrema nucula]|uniref:Ankyrin repeat-containing domain protein n=1 Tax=Lophiotrema nucula TaxID=690887 RepID=A0A6A5YP31_9PLEO|nr:ankyrin repeat-containing domain protein [Lophiotrema nucula]
MDPIPPRYDESIHPYSTPPGGDLNAYNEYGMTSIHSAIENNDTDLVRSLLWQGADPYKRISAELTPRDNAVEFAARLNRTTALQALIDDEIPVSINTLEAAVSQGNLDAANLLLQHTSEGKVKKESIAKALKTAAALWLLDMVRLLLQNGPIDNSVLNVTLLAACTNNQFVLDLYQPTPAWDWDRAIAVVQLLLDAGASVKGEFDFGITPLHQAARQPYVPTRFILLLLEAGADVDARDTDQSTPLLWSLSYHRWSEEAVRELVRAGADANAVGTVYGNTPLHYAPTETIARLLLEGGADVHIKNEDWKTPLDMAKELDRHEVVELLGSSN